MENISKF